MIINQTPASCQKRRVRRSKRLELEEWLITHRGHDTPARIKIQGVTRLYGGAMVVAHAPVLLSPKMCERTRDSKTVPAVCLCLAVKNKCDKRHAKMICKQGQALISWYHRQGSGAKVLDQSGLFENSISKTFLVIPHIAGLVAKRLIPGARPPPKQCD